MFELRIDRDTYDRIIVNKLTGRTIATLPSDVSDEEAHKLAASQTLYLACMHASDKLPNDRVIERAIAVANGQHLLVAMLD